MSNKHITYTLMYGNVNKNLRAEAIFQLDNDDKYQTVKDVSSITTKIRSSYALSISEGFDKNRMFVPTQRYWTFADAFIRTVKLISDNINDLFPNINFNEFDIDPKALEIFRIEKAVQVDGYSMLPCIWVNDTSETFASISITDVKGGFIRIPIEDARLLSAILNKFDPINYQLSCMNLIGGIR